MPENDTVDNKDAAPPSETPTYAKNQVELAELLGRDRKTIQRWLKIEGCPGKTADGRYHVEAWQKWITDTNRRAGQKEKETKLDIETRTAALKQQQLEMELAETRGQLNDVEETCTVLTGLFAHFVQGLRTLRHDISPQIVGLPVAEANKRLGNAHDDLLQHLSLGDWAKKKRFWSIVSQRLCDLQRRYLPSTGP